jgi:hypothetical protein
MPLVYVVGLDNESLFGCYASDSPPEIVFGLLFELQIDAIRARFHPLEDVEVELQHF